jgi:hypothetical protein
MFGKLVVCFLVFLSFGFLSTSSSATILVVDDFDSGLTVNNVGGETGTWNCNPEDAEQFCKMELVDNVRVGNKGFSLKLTYDITTNQDYLEGFPKTAYNGYWSKLNGLDVSDYSYLTLYVKGDKEAGYTTTFWIELKDTNNNSRVQVSGVTSEWQKIKISLNEFSNIADWANLVELTTVFDQIVTAKEGVIYIDNIAFEQ